ncbi:hypothetical protein [Bacillus sp. RO1]|uniref:hypothetical protein n=1 Tax=Bacillus sp. RO1 TaxID=2722703 RepID=UPI0014571441|nr:hypothetical protein [Bacillus sp. RO1]NLP51288.1 hypothetical protein [Bacillus sp. RO1]
MNEEKILLAIERLEQEINSRIDNLEESLHNLMNKEERDKEAVVKVEKANFYYHKYLELERRIYKLEQKAL